MAYGDNYWGTPQNTLKVVPLPPQPNLKVVPANSTPGNLQGENKPVVVQKTAPVQGAKPVAKPKAPVPIPQASKAKIVVPPPAPVVPPAGPEYQPITVSDRPINEFNPDNYWGAQDAQPTVQAQDLQPTAYGDNFWKKPQEYGANFWNPKVTGVDNSPAPEYKAPNAPERKSLVQTFWDQMDMKHEQDKAVLNAAKGFAQGTARSGAAIALTGAGIKEYELGEDASEAEKAIKKIVFGDGALKDFSGVGSETFKSFGANSLGDNKYASFALGGVLSALDLTGAGKADDVLKLLAKSRNIDEIATVLRKIGVAEDMVDGVAARVAIVRKTEDVAQILEKVDQFQKSTRTARAAITPGKVMDDVVKNAPPVSKVPPAGPVKQAITVAAKTVESPQTKYSPKSQKITEIFNKSSGQGRITEVNGTKFEMGSFGRNHAARKAAELKADRFAISDLPETLRNVKKVYRASDDPTSYRYDNLVHVAKMPNGESRAVITRMNSRGAEEIIGWHKIDLQKNPNYIKSLESFGSSAGTRTQIDSLEGSSPVRLKDRTISSVPQFDEAVNPTTVDELISRRKTIQGFAAKDPANEAFPKAIARLDKRIKEAQKVEPRKSPLPLPKKMASSAKPKATSKELRIQPPSKVADKGSIPTKRPSDLPTRSNEKARPRGSNEVDSPTHGSSADKFSQDSSYGSTIRETGEKVKPPTGRGGITAPEVDFKAWKDKPTFGLARETLERNIERVAGKDADKVKKFIVDPVRENEAIRIDAVNTMKREVKELAIKYGIKPRSLEDALVMRFGEGRIDIEELKKLTPKWKEVKEFSEFFRNKYDELLEQVNAVRKDFGYEPIPQRSDYFRHFNEMNDIIGQFGLIMRKQDLPTEIAGMTDIFKPGKPFSTAELRRKGGVFTETAILGFDNYIESISKQIHHIDSIQRYRALEKYIREAGAAGEATLPHFIANLMDSGNVLSGKKARMDRAVESIFGRNAYSLLTWVKRKTSANMVGANISSAITNFIPFTQSLATTSKPAAVRGAFNALQSALSSNFHIIDGVKSSFLIRRFPDGAIAPKFREKIAEKGQILFGAVDKFVSTTIVSGKYYENIAKGMNPEVAMKLADDYASKVLGDRSVGQMPLLFETKTLGAVTQFQLEVNNMVSFLIRDMPKMAAGNKKKMASMVGQFVLYSYLYNEAFEKITGRRPTIDPIHAALTAFGVTNQSEDSSPLKRVSDAAKELGSSLPGGNLFLEGGRIPITSSLPNIPKVLKGEADLLDEAAKPMLSLFPPTGGSQIKKTYGGLKTFLKGKDTDDKGNTKYKIDKTPANFFRSILFGKSSTPEAKQYRDEKAGGLTDAESRIKPIYDEAQELKAEGKKDEANELVNSLPEEDQKTYVEYKKKQVEKDGEKLRPKVQEIYNKAQDLKADDKVDEANKFVNDSLNDDEKIIYQQIKKEAAEGKLDASKTTEGNFISSVMTYAKAIGTDPVTAFNRILTDQKIRRVDNGAIIVYRLPMKESQAIKKETDQANAEYKLDHTIPLQLGGSNTEDNLKIITTEEHANYTAAENHLGKLLRNRKISRKEAQNLIRDFKEGKISKDEVMARN